MALSTRQTPLQSVRVRAAQSEVVPAAVSIGRPNAELARSTGRQEIAFDDEVRDEAARVRMTF